MTKTAVQSGDIIVFDGTPHRIVSTSDRNGFGWPVARAGDGWGITLTPEGTLPIPCPNDRWCVIQ